jgi:hypothetical protein
MSTWDAKCITPSSPEVTVLEQVHALFQQQRETWFLLRDNEATLASMKIKTFSIDNKHIIVQANPGRSISTNAKVDPKSVAERPCFLCPDSVRTVFPRSSVELHSAIILSYRIRIRF